MRKYRSRTWGVILPLLIVLYGAPSTTIADGPLPDPPPKPQTPQYDHQAQAWHVADVCQGRIMGMDLKFDMNGSPAIAINDWVRKSVYSNAQLEKAKLTYAWISEGGWHFETVVNDGFFDDGIDPDSNEVYRPSGGASLAFDAAGHPCITCTASCSDLSGCEVWEADEDPETKTTQDTETKLIIYSQRVNGEWTTEIVKRSPTAAIRSLELVMSAQNHPTIVYSSWPDLATWIAWANKERPRTGDSPRGSLYSIKAPTWNMDLFIASHDGSRWRHATVADPGTLAAVGSAIAIDSAGNPRVLHWQGEGKLGTTGNLYYASYQGTSLQQSPGRRTMRSTRPSWTSNAVDSTGKVAQRPLALALDSDGQPVVAYCVEEGDDQEKVFKIARLSSGKGTPTGGMAGWHKRTLGRVDKYMNIYDIAVDGQGRCAVLYCHYRPSSFDTEPSILHCGWYDGTDWNVSVVDPTDDKPGSALVRLNDGVPHVLFTRDVEGGFQNRLWYATFRFNVADQPLREKKKYTPPAKKKEKKKIINPPLRKKNRDG